MSEHQASLRWIRGEQTFTDVRYSRAHEWHFDGVAIVRASASPEHVRVPLSDPAAVDPEEAFVAALASCHMLVFLHLASLRGLVVDEYDDTPVGTVAPDAAGHLALVRVVLRPRVAFRDPARVSNDALEALHDEAHEGCFLARALRAELEVQPRRGADPSAW